MSLIDDVKAALRISVSTVAFNGEVADLIAAARNDLILSGILPIKANDDADPLIKRAVTVYVKANFGWDNPDAGRLQQSYDLLKMHLSLAQDYNSYAVTFTVKRGAVLLEDATVTFNGVTKVTDSSGVAVFIGVKPEQNMKYTVTLTGYIDSSGMVDIAGSTSVVISMTVVV